VSRIVLKPPILQVDLYIKQGADYTVELTGLTDANGNPIVDPTGYTITAMIRTQPNGLALFIWTDKRITYNATTSKSTLTLAITGAQTALFVFEGAVWDCFVKNPADELACLAEGTVTVDQSITY
jgi:hypothetical protein